MSQQAAAIQCELDAQHRRSPRAIKLKGELTALAERDPDQRDNAERWARFLGHLIEERKELHEEDEYMLRAQFFGLEERA
jgi:hypothetical protein